MRPAELFEDVAGAILDGTPVDWTSIAARAEETDAALVEQLKTLAALRLVTRRAESPEGAAPTLWGHLRVLERIGHGAFGDVYRAWDTRLDREVALKLLPNESAVADSPASSIIEEGRLLARVRHPNVVTIYGAERIDGRIGLWMELVKGRTLEQALRDGPTFTEKEVTGIGVELCRAVAAVHAAGLLHRDIKAQNVMVADDGRLVLMDFGTGRESDNTSKTNVAGTPLYLAPEVLSGGVATPQSEVYSIGVLLYHLLTGSYPVQGRDLAYLRRAHAAREQADAGTSGPRIPPRLGRVIAKAIDPDPNRRHASADALGAALTACERVPAARRTAYSIAAAMVIIAVGSVVWTLGARDLFRPKSPVAGVAAVWPADVAPVIVVMPFKSLSSEPENEYPVDGLTSEVIRNLSPPLIEGLQVRSPTSSLWVKDKPRDLAMIGEQLGVNLIVEGDVLRVGSQIRINARLVRVADDLVIWGDTFPGTVEDVLAIQGKIALAIANELRLNLGKGQRNYKVNPRAYELYLRARAVMPGRSEGRGLQLAEDLYKQVTKIEPTFAPAWAGLAGLPTFMGWNLNTLDYPDMRPAALKARDLDPTLAEAHVAMGITYAYEYDWENATKSFVRALELNPNLTQIHSAYSDALVLMGQPQQALQLLDQAISMDPKSLIVRRDLAVAQFMNGHFDDAIENAQTVRDADPEFNVDLILVRALTRAGRHEEAIKAWEHRRVRPGNPASWERWLVRAYTMTGRQKDVNRLVAAHRNAEPYHQAIIYAGLENKDRTFDALNRAAMDRRTPALVVSPETGFLRGDARLGALKKTLRLP